ncbi:MAG: hypothetical protein KME17_17520 [Cyanosarcina radialis HA8281-LM2]|jgi:hypothetical protein|nr:hypothetical protein [Cyanosarcina radialis HA8281-LM2]
MLQTIEGIYQNGKIQLVESPVGIAEGRVIVTFLETKLPQQPEQIMRFGMFANSQRSTEDDFRVAEFHGDPDNNLNWS